MEVSMGRRTKSDGGIVYCVSTSAPSSQIILPTHKLALEVLQFVSNICEDYERRLASVERDRVRAYEEWNKEREKNSR